MFESSSPISSPAQGHQGTAWAYVGELEAMAQWLTESPDSSPALESAVARMDTFRGAATVTRWLHNVAAARNPGLSDVAVISRLDAIVDGVRRYGPSSPEMTDEITARLAVLESLCSIPDNYRCALLLKEGAGLTVERTARLMGVSTASLRSILYRARQALAP